MRYGIDVAPFQRPRVPMWVGGTAAGALLRAARWDGWIVAGDDQEVRMTLSPDSPAAQVSELRRHRPLRAIWTWRSSE
ncbi:hypothetical protein [Nonomuraea gerenzanensis]|nr:hypothetical protein [Nonomuraea gerenzanensis]UBU16345.1 hypothetical protein LCN96_15415 [Nonomuraea gerenzanensis]